MKNEQKRDAGPPREETMRPHGDHGEKTGRGRDVMRPKGRPVEPERDRPA